MITDCFGHKMISARNTKASAVGVFESLRSHASMLTLSLTWRSHPHCDQPTRLDRPGSGQRRIQTGTKETKKAKRKTLSRRSLMRLLGALLLAIGVSGALIYRDQLNVATLIAWVNEAGAAGPLILIGVYAVATVLFLPGSVITLAGGALFGPFWGALYSLTGSTLGAALAFLIGRYLAGDWVQARTEGLLERLVRGVEAEGWRFVAFIRLVPLFPFNLVNHPLGLTRIPFLSYLLATFVFMIPGALAYSWLGFAGRQAMTGGQGLIGDGLIALALLAAVAFLPRLVARLRQKESGTDNRGSPGTDKETAFSAA